MTEREDIAPKIHTLIAPFNKKGVAVTDATTFARIGDLTQGIQQGLNGGGGHGTSGGQSHWGGSWVDVMV